MSSDFSHALSDAVIRRLATDQSYLRGLDYCRHGQVGSAEQTASGIRSLVRGNKDYTVILSSNDGILDYRCDCPQGTEGTFCKHCVAAAVAWLHRDVAPPRPKPSRKDRITLLGVETSAILT